MVSVRSDSLVNLNVNGRSYQLSIDPSRTLLEVIRDDLDLTGAKKACDKGECGSCIVLLGSKGVMSCLLPVKRAQGKDITTIEGLTERFVPNDTGSKISPSDLLHPLQKTFVELGASQCGFCIPGIIMEATALINGNPSPSRVDIEKRLSRNICRCTGYIKIIDAIDQAARIIRGEDIPQKEANPSNGTFGFGIQSLDAVDEVTGKAKFAADLKRQGMLYAKILRSPYHHAKILNIDTSKARALSGVEAVVSAKDVPGHAVMLNCRPQYTIYAQGKVRFKGEAIAAVAAISEEIAEKAIQEIDVEYELIPEILDPLDAFKEDLPKLHEPHKNWDLVQEIDIGNVDKAFIEADVVVENTYTSQPWEHAAMEPEAALAYQDEHGTIVVHSPQHHPFVGRDWVAEILDIPYEKVRFICPSMGGNFGMRGDFLHSGSAALLSYKTGKPVKIVFSREESLLGSSKSHSFVLKYKTGVDKNGKIVAFEAEIVGDGGCWIHHPGPSESRLSTIAGIAELVPGPFNVSNARIKVYEVCTNRPRSIPMRGTNMPQLAFAWDSQMDQLAKKLDIDPLELRLLNAVDSGSTMINGAVLDESVGTRATLEAIKKPYKEAFIRAKKVELPDNWKRGIGVSTLWQVNGGGRGEGGGGGWHGRKLGPAKAAVELTEEGLVRVLVGAVEKGQGVITALAQIAAEELKLPLNSISMIYGDTLLAPYPVGTSGQRTSMHVGGAITKACQGLLNAVNEAASKIFGSDQRDIVINGDQVFSQHKPKEELSLGSIATYMKDYGIPLKYEGSFVLEKTETEQGPIYAYASQISEVDVNIETGEVKLRNVTYAADVGRVINPLSFEGQVEGGIVMGMSYALKEQYRPGETTSLKEYGLPDIREAPDKIKTIIVENPVSGGPFGSKGGAEMPVSPGAASISNAIYNATGARVFDLPMTPDKVLEALRSNLP